LQNNRKIGNRKVVKYAKANSNTNISWKKSLTLNLILCF